MRKPTIEEAEALETVLREVQIITDSFEERKPREPKTLQTILKGKLAPQLLVELPHSMDIIGHIAIIELTPALERYSREVGEAILETSKRVTTVLAKAGAVSGKHRVRALKIIAGKKETETVYKEHGCTFALDPTKVYFSPRLSSERLRITQKVRDDEVVLDMFAGVGPFSIQIAKKHSNVTVYAVDINPIAIQFLKRNILLNKVENVIPILGDARNVVEENLTEKADRVIMNLPEDAMGFIDVACRAMRPSSGVIHYYGFWSGPNALKNAKETLKKTVEKAGRSVERVLDSRLVRPIAPYEWQVAIDIAIS